jgi:hypothetical protein
MNIVELVTNVKEHNLLTQNLAKLVITLLKEPFQKRGLYFIGLVKLVGRLLGNWYILVAIDYATKWVEAQTLHNNIVAITTKFLYKYILARFRCPLIVVTNQVTHLSMMGLDTLLTISFLDIPVLLFIIHKDMNRLSLQTRFLESN